MGFSGVRCGDGVEPLQASVEAKPLIPRGRYNELKDYDGIFKSGCNFVRGFAVGCLIPHYRRQISRRGVNRGEMPFPEESGSDADEPQSVHSSFRLNMCPGIELEPDAVDCSRSPAAVLMVNLEIGFPTPSNPEVAKSRQFELLERTISPVAPSLIRFTYSEIVSATDNFFEGRILARGRLSCVFRGRVGFLKTSVAIKKLNNQNEESSKAFCRELTIAASLHNPHIVPVVGFCIDPEGGLFLVYKYVSGGSLERFLHEERKLKGCPALSWSARYKVAFGIAEALAYLHYGTDECIVHRDIKPANILVSTKKKAKLCDFDLALRTPAPSVPFLCKAVKGTFGYLAPEYFQHGKVSEKTDVYAFGVVLLELITGRRPIEPKRGPGEENLVLWAKPLLQQGTRKKLFDPRLKVTRKNSSKITRMVRAATACLQNEESFRSDMRSIILILRGEETSRLSRKRVTLSANSRIKGYSRLQRMNSVMKSDFALAMTGVESEEADPPHFGRYPSMLKIP